MSAVEVRMRELSSRVDTAWEKSQSLQIKARIPSNDLDKMRGRMGTAGSRCEIAVGVEYDTRAEFKLLKRAWLLDCMTAATVTCCYTPSTQSVQRGGVACGKQKAAEQEVVHDHKSRAKTLRLLTTSTSLENSRPPPWLLL